MLDNLFSWNVLLVLGTWAVLAVYFFKKVAYNIKEENGVLTVKERLAIINFFSSTSVAGGYSIVFFAYKLVH